MSQTQLAEPSTEMATLIRNEPVQARSAARLMALLDAAAAVIDEIGYERLTTAMVAERADASIGTVYRYFPDRIAVLQSLAARNVERMTERAVEILEDPAFDDWESAADAVVDAYIDAFRAEPGFASLRLGDVLDIRPRVGAPANTVYADRLITVAGERFGLDVNETVLLAAEAAFETLDALTARAFARDPEGFAPLLEVARREARGIVSRALQG